MQAKRDGNYVKTILGTLNSDGATPICIEVNPSTKGLKVEDNSTGSDNGPTPERAVRDQNYVPVLIAISSADGVTPVAVYADATGHLLIDHT